MMCVCGCGARADVLHHVVYQQEIRRRGGDPGDPRGMVPIRTRCHERHHGQLPGMALALRDLPDEALEFAQELMGAAAYDYLHRRYRGDDPRVEAMIGG